MSKITIKPRIKNHIPSKQALGELLASEQHTSGPVISSKEGLDEEQLSWLLLDEKIKPIVPGWYYVTRDPILMPQDDNRSDWYRAYWPFIVAYLDDKYGNAWCLSADSSLLFHSGNGLVPTQLTVRCDREDDSVLKLPCGLELLEVGVRGMDEEAVKESRYGLRLFSLPHALMMASPWFFSCHPTEARTCISLLQNVDIGDFPSYCLDNPLGMARLAGALKSLGHEDIPLMKQVVKGLVGRGFGKMEIASPFKENITIPMNGSAVASRIRLMWDGCMGAVLFEKKLQEIEPKGRTDAEVMRMMDKAFVDDAVNSILLDGGSMTPELAAMAADETWEPDTRTEQDKLLTKLAAKGYGEAFRMAKHDILDALTGGECVAELVRCVPDWHRELLLPFHRAGLEGYDTLRYRDRECPVTIDRYIPVAPDAIPHAMRELCELMRSEPDPFVRAVMGHFFIMYIQPFGKGNGLVARLLMNSQLVTGGYPWITIPESKKTRYGFDIEYGCVEDYSIGLASLVASLVSDQMLKEA